MKHTTKLLSTVALMLACVGFGVTSCNTTATPVVKPMAKDAKVETVNLALTGLKWGASCPPRVQAALLEVDGVSSAAATKTTATVVVDRNKVTNAQLIAAVTAANKGYGATVVK